MFLWAMGASTILPLSSEATLIYYLKAGSNLILLLISAGVGNTIGSVINYLLGSKGIDYLISKNHLSKEKAQKAHKLFEKYGSSALLFSWLPIIGDPITMVAGVAKYPFWKFVALVALAKFGRYAILIWLSKDLLFS
jgi:membrane protein YqaA with SNARE-associated domain